MIELCCEYLSIWYIWQYVIIMSRTCFRVNLHNIVAWMSRSPCLKQMQYLKFKRQQRDSNPQLLSSWTNTQPFTQTGQMHRTDEYSQHSSIIWPVWLTGWVFFYKLSCFGFEYRCCHLNFWYHASLEQRVPWHSNNYRV